MHIRETDIEGLIILEPRVFKDERGYFFESFRAATFSERGMNAVFIQDNESRSGFGVIRGLHFQKEPHAQSKLVRVVEGSVFDVAVDLRPGSPSFGKWFGLELSAENKTQLLIPKGFAHGFSVLSKQATVIYKCDAYYHPESESGIRYDDPQLAIDWRIDPSMAIVSEKDQALASLEQIMY